MDCLKFSDLMMLASEDNFGDIIETWANNGYLMYILPEIATLDEYFHNMNHHPEGSDGINPGTPLDHTICAVKIADREHFSPLVKIAVLFHDVGKSITGANYNKETHPYHNFYQHDIAGCKLFKKIAQRLEIPEEEFSYINECIRQHMRFHMLPKMTHDTKILAMTQVSCGFSMLKDVCYCDEHSRFPLESRILSPHYVECLSAISRVRFQKKEKKKSYRETYLLRNNPYVWEDVANFESQVSSYILKNCKKFSSGDCDLFNHHKSLCSKTNHECNGCKWGLLRKARLLVEENLS